MTDVPHDDPTAILRRNLLEVFGERDPARRRAVIDELYVADTRFAEAGGTVQGRDAVDAAVGRILDDVPPNFRFVVEAEPAVVDGLGRIGWGFGPPDGPPAVHGMDVATFRDGRIDRLWTFLDAPPQDGGGPG
ncbi:nuclear transport factor 2 family protein [Patulibacter americanus]|uniref:nuclear transport factor 2 family protein n=1 Tax=Patulibacter americanus TaxID=588672 RepID=UPI0003B796E9|nr:nuclear transport factor 2 family protein [Patulibacter americanus]